MSVERGSWDEMISNSCWRLKIGLKGNTSNTSVRPECPFGLSVSFEPESTNYIIKLTLTCAIRSSHISSLSLPLIEAFVRIRQLFLIAHVVKMENGWTACPRQTLPVFTCTNSYWWTTLKCTVKGKQICCFRTKLARNLNWNLKDGLTLTLGF